MPRKKLPVPEFDTPEEEDEFWQTHSPLDFRHEEVERPPRRFRFPTKSNFTVRLDPRDRELLDELAERLGERPSAIARRYIRAGLQREEKQLRAE